jgi:hypothetical protein
MFIHKQGNRDVINALRKKLGGKDYGSKQENAEGKFQRYGGAFRMLPISDKHRCRG